MEKKLTNQSQIAGAIIIAGLIIAGAILIKGSCLDLKRLTAGFAQIALSSVHE